MPQGARIQFAFYLFLRKQDAASSRSRVHLFSVEHVWNDFAHYRLDVIVFFFSDWHVGSAPPNKTQLPYFLSYHHSLMWTEKVPIEKVNKTTNRVACIIHVFRLPLFVVSKQPRTWKENLTMVVIHSTNHSTSSRRCLS